MYRFYSRFSSAHYSVREKPNNGGLGIVLRDGGRILCTMVALALVSSLLTVDSVSAGQIYRKVDEHGNVIFSDTPSENAEVIEVDPSNVQGFPEPPAVPTAKPKAEPFRYDTIEITRPADEATLRNVRSVTVGARLLPALKRSHRLQFLLNGSVVSKPASNTSARIDEIVRGAHQIQAQVVDKQGKVIQTSDAITIFVHKTSIAKPKPAPKPANP